MTTQRRTCTPADARACWESFEEKAKTPPTVRGVAKALNASGQFHEVAPATVGRWHKANWQVKPPNGQGRQPKIVEAQAKLEQVVPALTGDPTTRLSDLKGKPSAPKGDGEKPSSTEAARPMSQEEILVYAAEQTAKVEKVEGEKLKDEHLDDIMRTAIVVSRVSRKLVGPILLEQPGQMIGILTALMGSVVAAAQQRKLDSEAGTGMKVIEGEIIEGERDTRFDAVFQKLKAIEDAA